MAATTPNAEDSRAAATPTGEEAPTVDYAASTMSTHTMITTTFNVSEQQRRRDDQLVLLSPETLVDNRWHIIKKLGSGAFGAVYLCKDINDERHWALKTEAFDAYSTLSQEVKILRAVTGLPNFCQIIQEGQDVQVDAKSGRQVAFNYLVMSLVGRGLDRLLSKTAGGHFSLGTAIGASIQLLNALKALHSVGYIHLDVKPENTAIGRRETNERRLLYLIDFGLARRYLSSDGQLRRQRSKAHFRGTPQYASINAHSRKDYSRRDDIESWFYVMVELCTGRLPWSRIRGERRTGEAKSRRLSTDPDVRQRALNDLLQHCPQQFARILEHIDGLQFTARPNYEMIENLLRAYASDRYDWET